MHPRNHHTVLRDGCERLGESPAHSLVGRLPGAPIEHQNTPARSRRSASARPRSPAEALSSDRTGVTARPRVSQACRSVMLLPRLAPASRRRDAELAADRSGGCPQEPRDGVEAESAGCDVPDTDRNVAIEASIWQRHTSSPPAATTGGSATPGDFNARKTPIGGASRTRHTTASCKRLANVSRPAANELQYRCTRSTPNNDEAAYTNPPMLSGSFARVY